MSGPISTNDALAVDLQRTFLQQDRQSWINSRFILQSRMKAVVNLIDKKILTDEAKTPILDELTKIEAWIAEYDDQLKALEPVNGKGE